MSEKKQTQLQKHRLAAGLSQAQLAKKSGIPAGTIKRHEQLGTIGSMKISNAKALADALGVPIEALLEPDDQ